MKKATPWLLVAAIATLLALTSGPATAQPSAETPSGTLGRAYVNFLTGETVWNPGNVINVPVVVYDNTASPANFGFSSTDLAAVFGDRVTTTATGVLSEITLTLFNSPSSAGPVLTSTIGVQLFDGGTSLPLGAFSVNLNFGAGLSPGFYSLLTVTNLAPLAINLSTTDVIVLQTVTALTGGANRLGIASLNPPTVGSSANSMYISATTVGPPGYYVVGGNPSNPGYKLTLDIPVPAQPTSWGRVKALYR